MKLGQIGHVGIVVKDMEEAKARYSVNRDIHIVAAGKFRTVPELTTVFSTRKIDAIGENRVQEFRDNLKLVDFQMVGSAYDDSDPWQTLLIPKTIEGKTSVWTDRRDNLLKDCRKQTL